VLKIFFNKLGAQIARKIFLHNVIILLASSRKSYSSGSVSNGKFSGAPHCHCVYPATFFYESLAHTQNYTIPVKIKIVFIREIKISWYVHVFFKPR
jgi:hypothetical protein